MAVAERKQTDAWVRVKPHPTCPHCGVVMKYNGRPSHSPRITHYKCPMAWCGETSRLYDAFLRMSDIPDAPMR